MVHPLTPVHHFSLTIIIDDACCDECQTEKLQDGFRVTDRAEARTTEDDSTKSQHHTLTSLSSSPINARKNIKTIFDMTFAPWFPAARALMSSSAGERKIAEH